MPWLALLAPLAEAAAGTCGDPVACALVLLQQVLGCIVFHHC
jgi:hypothetical protein